MVDSHASCYYINPKDLHLAGCAGHFSNQSAEALLWLMDAQDSPQLITVHSLHCWSGVGEGRKVKLFTMNCCEHTRELHQHPICTVQHVIFTSSDCEISAVLSVMHMYRHKTSSSLKRSLIHQNKNLRFRTAPNVFPEYGSGRFICFLPSYYISNQKSLSAVFIKLNFCSLQAVLPKHKSGQQSSVY